MTEKLNELREAARKQITDEAMESLIIAAHKLRAKYPPGTPVDDIGLGVRFGFDTGFSTGFDAGTLTSRNEWRVIRTSEDLPKENDGYLVTHRPSLLTDYASFDPASQGDIRWWLNAFIAWQPKPEPYTDDKNSGKGE